ncbi:TPA: hypothetical protein ACGUON_004460 [Vibrio vulnificus]|uniref:hypothetical protein n=1 Tax=Vibrio vulnificus TaxID=672 RepID=UPI001A1CE368|nr:hypothetical protein [Vibrio vulnificus]MDS1773806.1 hypothetical protein [Vibrio vulnificus]MDS1855088.1 hypothetical protein [Vibrio vulnificus]HAS6322815.1 hypothetical protein [Vibrio vulnificus]HAU8295497.1 hypothetical protein [Vibrio vulnificus]HDY7594489.1 hypothetical protein [Vibrio vulnificus]
MEILNLFLDYPIELPTAIVVVILMLRGKWFHAMYVLYGVAALVVVVEIVGFDQFLAGIFVGVFANEVFRIIRKQLEKESN